MSYFSKARYHPIPLADGVAYQITSDSVGGFLCISSTSATLTIVRNNDDGTTFTVVNALPVTAGTWIDIPFYLGKNGGTATLTGGTGTLAI